MSLLFRVIYAAHASSTHHKLALDALEHLDCPYASRWRDVFLKHHVDYLTGSKAPDVKFKDFTNHVLHVEQSYWGGAPKTARKWYARLVEALEDRAWQDAAYCAGVLSHYYTDPIQPFHTGQSAAESNIHRAAEWSICKSYEQLREQAQRESLYVDVATPRGSDWLEQMVTNGADKAHEHYQPLIDHYDFNRGVKDPPAGLDDYSRKVLAELIAYATVGFARVLEQAFEEACATPPVVSLTLETVVATLEIPVRWVTKRLADAEERRLVEAMYDELQRTGKVEQHLPEESRQVRAAVEREQPAPTATTRTTPPVAPEIVTKPAPPDPTTISAGSPLSTRQPTPQPAPQPTPTTSDTEPAATPRPFVSMEANSPAAAPQPAHSLRFYLDLSDDVVDAPSIGPKTAARLTAIGVRTVQDLLKLNPESAADKIDARHITAQTIEDWQAQANLVCRVPNLRGHDAQILVACGYRTPEAVAGAAVATLLDQALEFAATREGERVIRSGKAPDHDEVSEWIACARQARSARAA
ncbi:MAG: DUF4332 domain-containing protein [Planctomycetales bacterium]|nr:DUF4332 domain-containing protein [Planctomycetales bacterium]